VNRIQQFRNIPSRSPGSAVESLLDHKQISRAEHHAESGAIFHFPSEKGDFRNGTWSFISIRDQVNFHISRDLYQRPPLARFPGEGAFRC
jgi:hypothetical protein